MLLYVQVLTGILRSTEVPFSSYLAFPRTPLHFVDARIKQLWLISMLVLIPRVLWQFRLGLAAAVLVLSAVCLPKRVSSAQLRRLLSLCALLFIGTACSADQIVMSATAHAPPPELVGLPSLEALNDGYKCASSQCYQVDRLLLAFL
jgi:energy-coupling factor transporter transmembrane protein EcfT